MLIQMIRRLESGTGTKQPARLPTAGFARNPRVEMASIPELDGCC